MSTCICSTCKNLKSIVDDKSSEQEEILETCEFGFPSEDCSACEDDHCELSCEHYISDSEEETFCIVQCVACSKELKVIASKAEAGEVYCPACYLEKLI